MLCFRCEHRAKYLEATSRGDKYAPRPRSECGDINSSKIGCYMFEPCHPVVTEPPKGAPAVLRFQAPMLASREYAVKVLEREDNIKLEVIYENGKQVALGWKVKNES